MFHYCKRKRNIKQVGKIPTKPVKMVRIQPNVSVKVLNTPAKSQKGK